MELKDDFEKAVAGSKQLSLRPDNETLLNYTASTNKLRRAIVMLKCLACLIL